MKFEDALKLAKQGKRMKRKDGLIFSHNIFEITDKNTAFNFCTADFMADDWEEYEEPLLTEEEKEFLKTIIKFCPEEVNSVSLEKLSCYRDYNFNMIGLTHTDGDRNSYDVKEDYFQKLEDKKIYTLKELGLEI